MKMLALKACLANLILVLNEKRSFASLRTCQVLDMVFQQPM